MPEKRIKLKIAQQHFFNNGKIVLESLTNVHDSFLSALSQEVELSTIQRTSKGKSYEGITADSLNKKIRECLTNIQGIKNETLCENGYFLHIGKEGFDFSIYDEQYNISKIYNHHLGSVGILNGEEKIIELYKKTTCKKNDWKKAISSIKDCIPANTDYVIEKKHLTIVGEIQFANWAVADHDLFKLLRADAFSAVDLYIYITSTGKLEESLSSNTVSYSKIVSLISKNHSIIKVPIWIIGLDIEEA